MREFTGIDLTKDFYKYPITSMIGLTTVNIELTNRCNKSCWMCGRRRMEKEHPDLCKWDDMDLELALNIVQQLPEGIIIQFHDNGEPLLYPYLSEILSWSYKQIRCFDTNGKLLLERANEIIHKMESLTISVIENDPEQDEQYEIVKKFLEIKKDRKPFMIYRLLGNVAITPDKEAIANGGKGYFIDDKRKDRWYKLPGIVATRVLHSPYGSYNYEKEVTIPEVGFCWEVLSHMVINVEGLVSICVRFDPLKELVIGNCKKEKLVDIWNGEKRLNILKKHIDGKRNELPYCGKKCHYWGIPRGD